MKLYADLTELNERDMSGATLKRLRWYGILSLPFTPLGGFWALKVPQSVVPDWALGILVILTAVPLFILCTSRVVNRVWVRDKYLDEWELRLKHRSMAFGFQVVLYAISLFFAVGVVLDIFNALSLPEITGNALGYGLFSIMMLGLYAQMFSQFEMMQPIDEDEFGDAAAPRKLSKRTIFIAIGIFGLVMVPPFVLGFIKGYKDVRSVASLGGEAKIECEARGSSVHWVSVKNGGDFACFDENRPSPSDLDPSPKKP